MNTQFVTHDPNTQFVTHDPRRRPEVGLEWTFDARRASPFTLVNGVVGTLPPVEAIGQTRRAVTTWTAQPCYRAYFAEVPYPVAPGYENIEFIDDFYLGGEMQPFHPVAEHCRRLPPSHLLQADLWTAR